ncbi:MAG: (2Fe-2S) ferredoxin domain-containing protein [Nitrospiraceae bacterium]|nr:MAG: (2Fe-2S) ferredoxin domain-containing protein [Nitrospiraceae bacterium]
MNKFSIEDLKKIKENYSAVFNLKEGGYRAKVIVHMGPCGVAAGANKVLKAMVDEILKANITDVIVKRSSCGGLCAREPLATVELINQPPVRYCKLNDRKAREIFREHVLRGNPVEKYALVVGCETTC